MVAPTVLREVWMIYVYKNTRRLLTNVRVVWYNILNQIQTVEAEITVYVDPTESPGG